MLLLRRAGALRGLAAFPARRRLSAASEHGGDALPALGAASAVRAAAGARGQRELFSRTLIREGRGPSSVWAWALRCAARPWPGEGISLPSRLLLPGAGAGPMCCACRWPFCVPKRPGRVVVRVCGQTGRWLIASPPSSAWPGPGGAAAVLENPRKVPRALQSQWCH